MNIGQNIKRIREIKHLTQKAVADNLGMSVTAYGSIERGDANLNFKKLAEIAQVLQVNQKEIINFTDDIYHQAVNENEVMINKGGINTFEKAALKELYDKIIKDKDEEIAFLRMQLNKK